MLQTLPATLISGGGHSLIRYDPVDKLLYRIEPNGKWHRADGGSKKAASNPARLVPVPKRLATQAARVVSAIQTLSTAMDKVTKKR
jgi:hypothetical protein